MKKYLIKIAIGLLLSSCMEQGNENIDCNIQMKRNNILFIEIKNNSDSAFHYRTEEDSQFYFQFEMFMQKEGKYLKFLPKHKTFYGISLVMDSLLKDQKRLFKIDLIKHYDILPKDIEESDKIIVYILNQKKKNKSNEFILN